MDGYKLTPTMTKFVEWCQEMTKPIIADRVAEAKEQLSDVGGLIDNIHDKKQEIEEEILNNTLLRDNEIKELDKALQKIMNEK
jgi:hypothetical protein